MRIKGENSFVSFLELLKVTYTKDFSNQYYNEHPHKFNLYGLSEMLSGYGIRNAATKIEDKGNDLFNIELPFITYVGGDFVVVYKVELDNVHYIRNGKKISTPVSQFVQSWSGVVLLAETSPTSIEPDYLEHRKKDLLIIVQKTFLSLACILLLGFTFLNTVFDFSFGENPGLALQSPYSVLGISLLLLINLIGVYISYLLILKQMRIQSRYADKICTLFSRSDCNNVLESDAAKLWGVFGWSEIGLGYFSANIVMLLFLPQLITYLSICNILTLPYTAWSVWYQKVKAQQWCPLCLIVQILLWLIFIINLSFGYINTSNLYFLSPLSIFIPQLILVGCIYAIPVLICTLLIPKLSKGNHVEQLRQEINSIKANDELFKTLLKQQPFYKISRVDSQILFRNLEANLLITILTNPFCNPCAKMHTRIENWINGRGESHSPTKIKNVCIQYIFSAFNENMEYVNRYFIAAYLEKGSEAAWQLYTDWFEKGKALKEAFFEDLKLDMSNPAIEIEFQKHESWKAKTQIRATPTIIINGYKLPENYKIEDLRYLVEFTGNVK